MTDAASHSEQRRRATLVGAGAVFLWGSLAILTTLTGEIQPFQIVATAFFVAFLLALIKWIIRGESLTAPFRQSSLAWAVGVGGLFGYHFLIFLALKISPPVQANLINYLWPLMIVLFSALLPGQTLRPRHIAGALAGFSGACLLVTGGNTLMPAPEYIPGYVAALAAGLVWTGYSLASSRLTSVSTNAIGAFCLVAAILSTGAHILFETTVTPVDGRMGRPCLPGAGSGRRRVLPVGLGAETRPCPRPGRDCLHGTPVINRAADPLRPGGSDRDNRHLRHPDYRRRYSRRRRFAAPDAGGSLMRMSVHASASDIP